MKISTAVQVCERPAGNQPNYVETFASTLNRYGVKLERGDTTILQINIGLLCNQACKHCHLDAGPTRSEIMDEETFRAVVAFAERNRFDSIDITGGATELHPGLISMLERLAPLANRIMIRSNLSALEQKNPDRLIRAFKTHRVVVVASFPSFDATQLEAQRGKGIFQKSIDALRRLNSAGYGLESNALELNLVSNPTGAFLPPSQTQAEDRFRRQLKRKWGISFNHLYTFANVPLGRFRQWLEATGNLGQYLEKLRSSFNPCVVNRLMCRNLMSVSWDGYVYDCDFNLAKGLHLGGKKAHISETHSPPRPGTAIAVADHCYTCTAGSGFT
jgi:radical SAM/Cys-rich protein